MRLFDQHAFRRKTLKKSFFYQIVFPALPAFELAPVVFGFGGLDGVLIAKSLKYKQTDRADPQQRMNGLHEM
jgi:hypothetical protein